MTAQIASIVDAHVHWWDVETNPWYEFIRNVDETEGTDLHRNYLPPDYRRSIGNARVDKIVHVSAVVGTQRYLDELRWVLWVKLREQLLRGTARGGRRMLAIAFHYIWTSGKWM